jgi:hypothetical protein
MDKKEKFISLIVFTLAFAVGSFIGHGIGWAIFDRKSTSHVCQCETCKVIRQLEAVEMWTLLSTTV